MDKPTSRRLSIGLVTVMENSSSNQADELNAVEAENPASKVPAPDAKPGASILAKKPLGKTMSLGEAAPKEETGKNPSPQVKAEMFWNRQMEHLLRNGVDRSNKQRLAKTQSLAMPVYESPFMQCSSEYHQALSELSSKEAPQEAEEIESSG